jgi:hypothetical protein
VLLGRVLLEEEEEEEEEELDGSAIRAVNVHKLVLVVSLHVGALSSSNAE